MEADVIQDVSISPKEPNLEEEHNSPVETKENNNIIRSTVINLATISNEQILNYIKKGINYDNSNDYASAYHYYSLGYFLLDKSVITENNRDSEVNNFKIKIKARINELRNFLISCIENATLNNITDDTITALNKLLSRKYDINLITDQ